MTLSNIILKATGTSTMNYFKEIINEGLPKFWACVSSGVISVLGNFFAPIWFTIVAVFILILVDAVLGVFVSVQNGNAIESRKLWKTIKKLTWSVVAMSCARLVDLYIVSSIDLKLLECFAGMIAGVELWSMIESLQTLDPTGPWKIFSKFIKRKGEKYLDITIDAEDLPKVEKLVRKVK